MTVEPFPCPCGAPKEAQTSIVTPTGIAKHIQNLGVSPVAGHHWTVYRCTSCGHLQWFLEFDDA